MHRHALRQTLSTLLLLSTASAGATGVTVQVQDAGGKYVVKAWHYNTVGGATPEQVVTVKAGDAPASVTFKLPMKPIVADDPSSTTL